MKPEDGIEEDIFYDIKYTQIKEEPKHIQEEENQEKENQKEENQKEENQGEDNKKEEQALL